MFVFFEFKSNIYIAISCEYLPARMLHEFDFHVVHCWNLKMWVKRTEEFMLKIFIENRSQTVDIDKNKSCVDVYSIIPSSVLFWVRYRSTLERCTVIKQVWFISQNLLIFILEQKQKKGNPGISTNRRENFYRKYCTQFTWMLTSHYNI